MWSTITQHLDKYVGDYLFVESLEMKQRGKLCLVNKSFLSIN